MPFKLPRWIDGRTLNIWLTCGVIVGGFSIYEWRTKKFRGTVVDRWTDANKVQDDSQIDEEEEKEDEIFESIRK